MHANISIHTLIYTHTQQSKSGAGTPIIAESQIHFFTHTSTHAHTRTHAHTHTRVYVARSGAVTPNSAE